MLAIYVLATSLVAAAIIYWRSGYSSPQLPLAIGLLIAKATLLFSVTLAGSTLAPAIATGIAMLILYVVANVAGMVEQVGVAIGSDTMVQIGVVSSIVLPADALWKMAAATVQPPNPLPALGIPVSIGPFGVIHPPSIWMALYGVLYALAALGLASTLFTRRDL